MKQIIVFVFVIIFTLPALASADTRPVEGSTTGGYYNSVSERWTNEPISIYVDDQGFSYVRGGGSSLIMARGMLWGDDIDIPDFIELLEKGLEWGAIVKKEKIEITKDLGEILQGFIGEESGMKLTFLSINNGSDFKINLHIIDFDNRFKKISLFLREKQVKELIALVKKIPLTITELLKQKKKAELLK